MADAASSATANATLPISDPNIEPNIVIRSDAIPPVEMLKNSTTKELKAMANALGVVSSGRKSDLVERLTVIAHVVHEAQTQAPTQIDDAPRKRNRGPSVDNDEPAQKRGRLDPSAGDEAPAQTQDRTSADIEDDTQPAEL